MKRKSVCEPHKAQIEGMRARKVPYKSIAGRLRNEHNVHISVEGLRTFTTRLRQAANAT